jgi:hypothetical protein
MRTSLEPQRPRVRQFRNGAGHQLSAGLAALARREAQQPVSSIELQAVSIADLRAVAAWDSNDGGPAARPGRGPQQVTRREPAGRDGLADLRARLQVWGRSGRISKAKK